MLNYIEGFARKKKKVYLYFLEISYGSLKETKYLLYFSLRENFLLNRDYENIVKMSEEIGAMIWKTMELLEKNK